MIAVPEWQWVLVLLLFGAVIVSLYKLATWKREQAWSRYSRRLVDRSGARLKDIEANRAGPGQIVEFERDDGFPNGPRGEVWSEKKRAEYRRKCQRIKLRIIAGG